MSEVEEPQTVTLGNGICLQLKPFPAALIRRAVAEVVKPQPPKIQLEGKAGAEEENPDDPAYQAALGEYEAKTTEVAIDVMFVAGTEIASVPTGILRPEEDGWTDVLDHFHISFDRSTKYTLYLSWLRLYALDTLSDWKAVIQAVSETIGLSEREVDQAVESFPGGEVGGADNGGPSEDPGHGNPVPKNRAQRRARNRGKGGS